MHALMTELFERPGATASDLARHLVRPASLAV
jgi:hypothetical protein